MFETIYSPIRRIPPMERKSGSDPFAIPFNRQELADCLYVDRSAVSAEPGRIRGDGLLTFDRNRFTLL